MPVTPFHFGPGALVKATAPRQFSLRAFVVSQVVIDCETAWNLARGNPRLHTLFHTYVGATIAMALTILVLLAYNGAVAYQPRLARLFGRPFAARPALVGAVVGGWSHVFLDSLMHRDQRPFAPFSDANPALGLISVQTLHVACLACFALALLVGALRWRVRPHRR